MENITSIILIVLAAIYIIKDIVDYFEKRDPDNKMIEKIDDAVEKSVLLVEQVVRSGYGDRLTDQQKNNLKYTAINHAMSKLDDKAMDFIGNRLRKIRGLDTSYKRFIETYLGEVVEYTISMLKNKI